MSGTEAKPSDQFALMQMHTYGALKIHWGMEGIRLARGAGLPVRGITTSEAKWLSKVLPIVADEVEDATP